MIPAAGTAALVAWVRKHPQRIAVWADGWRTGYDAGVEAGLAMASADRMGRADADALLARLVGMPDRLAERSRRRRPQPVSRVPSVGECLASWRTPGDQQQQRTNDQRRRTA